MWSGSGSTRSATKDLLWLVILSNIVHGFAYAFFFATVYIFVDENFPKDVRTSAQSLFNLLILGLGPLREQLPLGLARRQSSQNRTTRSSIIIELFLVSARVGLAGDGDPGDLLPSQGERTGSRRGSRPCHLSRWRGLLCRSA